MGVVKLGLHGGKKRVSVKGCGLHRWASGLLVAGMCNVPDGTVRPKKLSVSYRICDKPRRLGRCS